MLAVGYSLATLGLGACGNVPQPFRRATNTSNPLLANPSGAGIGILPPAGIDRGTAKIIADRIAEELRQQEIPAEAVNRTGALGFTAEGNLRESLVDDSIATLTFDWRLLNRLGQIVTRIEQTVSVDSAGWTNGTPAAAGRVATDMAARLAYMLAPPIETERRQFQGKPWDGLTATIQRPPSAPGDGAQALGNAMANRLAREGFKPANGQPDVIFAAMVSVTRYDAVQDDIVIIWQILTPEGQNLGEVRLDNRIPTGELDGSWGMIAEAIVDGAMPGLLEIITETATPGR